MVWIGVQVVEVLFMEYRGQDGRRNRGNYTDCGLQRDRGLV